MNARELITAHLDLWTGAVTKKSSSGRGSNGKVELTGIKKLRALILQLAINGKLTEQHTHSESAKSLISKIADNQAALIASGMLKKQKKLPIATADDCITVVPKGWEPVRLGEILDRISNGFGGKQNKTGEGLPLTRIETISDGAVNLEKLGYSTDIPSEKQEYFKLQAGDILFSHINSDFHIGKTAIVPSNIEIYHGVNLLLLRPSELVSNRFIDIVINALRLDGYFLNIAQHAIGQASVNQGKVNNIAFALPPEEEQHRIVQKVDELMALCDRLEQQTSDQLEAHETLVDTLLGTLTQSENATELADNWARLAAHFDTLFTTEQSIDKLKQAILQLAVMGRLVEQNEHEESADRLLTALSASPVKVDETLFSIPSNWCWTRLGSISRINGGFAFKSSNYQETGVRVVRISDFDEYGFKNEAIVRHEYTEKLSGFQLAENDILMAMTGGTVGKSYLVEELPEPMVVNQRVATVKIPAPIDAKYIYFLLKTKSVREVIENAKNSTNDNISMKDIQNFLVPLPAAKEQHRIVQKVDELMALCDQLKERLNQASETRCQLAEAIVEQGLSA